MSSTPLSTVEFLLKQTGSRPAGDLKLALTRLSAEISKRTLQGSSASYDFFMTAVHAVTKMKGTTHADLRLSCLFDSALFFYRSGFAKPALQASDQANKLARRIENNPWIRKAETLLGIVHSEGGNIAESLVHYSEALRLARQIGDRWAEVAVLINLGTAFLYASLYGESIRCLAKAIELCDEPRLKVLAATAYCDMAQAYHALEEYERGFAAAETSLQLSDEPENSAAFFSRTIREYTYVQLALELGKLARAREHASACRRFSLWGDNARCRTLAQISTSLCEIRGGDVDRGLSQLEAALELSGDFIVSRIDVLNALVKAYDEAGRPEKALQYMTELLSVVRKMREQSIGALITLGADSTSPMLATGHTNDVKSLQLREARLRATVAQRELINSQLELLERLAATADLREDASGQHGYRVGRLASMLSEKIGFDRDALRNIEIAARLHDIGKVGVPDRILFASSGLRDAERGFMRSHATVGAELLAKSKFPVLQLAERVARHHHEWWDGTGYPSKLSGKRIPIHARIVALADVFDALTHGRPYSPPWSIDRALEEIKSKRGTQFDPDLTDAFLALIEDLRRKHKDLDGFLAEASRNSPFLQAREKIRAMLEGGRQTENIAAAAAETVH
jgi:putative two-component system response regulator